MTTPTVIDDLTLDLKGTIYQGPPGNDGDPGKSAYQSYLDTTSDNPVLSEAAWVASLEGKPGEDGDPGKSTYQSYLDTTTDNPKKTEAQWVASLQGKPGESVKGDPGKSSYQSYLDTTSDNPKLSEADWVKSLNGKPGDPGKDGKDGTGLTNRQEWVSGSVYSPGDYVFSNNADGNKSMWILSGTEDYVSSTEPKNDLSHWIEFQAPAGADGVGISGIAISYQGGGSATSVPTADWSSTPVGVAKGAYLWTRAVFTMTNGTTATQYSVSYQAVDGSPGAAGKGIASSAVTYQASTSGTATPTGSWTAAIPAVTKGQYLWTRTVLTLTDATTVTSYSVAYFATDGTNGNNGVGIDSVAIAYQASTSGTIAPSGTWSTTVPSVAKGQYLWTRTTLTLSSAATAVSYSVGYMGTDGTGGSGGSGTTVLVLTADPTGTDGADGSVAISTTAAGLGIWTRSGTTWTKKGGINWASNAEAVAALLNTVAMTPARVREYMESFGLTASFTAQATDLNSIVKSQFFNYSGAASGGTSHIPAAGTYGRGICIPSGDGYATQLAIENDTGKVYVRYQTAGTWDATWKLVGPSSGGGGGSGGTVIPAAMMTADKSVGATAAAMGFDSNGTLPVVNQMYMFKAVLLTQGAVGAKFNITFDNMGAQIMRLDCRSPNATGVITSSVTTQASVAMVGCTGAAQDGITIIEGVINFNYVGTTAPEMKVALASGDWMNMLKGSSYSLTPIHAVAS